VFELAAGTYQVIPHQFRLLLTGYVLALTVNGVNKLNVRKNKSILVQFILNPPYEIKIFLTV
jgi:hypothetical protein